MKAILCFIKAIRCLFTDHHLIWEKNGCTDIHRCTRCYFAEEYPRHHFEYIHMKNECALIVSCSQCDYREEKREWHDFKLLSGEQAGGCYIDAHLKCEKCGLETHRNEHTPHGRGGMCDCGAEWDPLMNC